MLRVVGFLTLLALRDVGMRIFWKSWIFNADDGLYLVPFKISVTCDSIARIHYVAPTPAHPVASHPNCWVHVQERNWSYNKGTQKGRKIYASSSRIMTSISSNRVIACELELVPLSIESHDSVWIWDLHAFTQLPHHSSPHCHERNCISYAFAISCVHHCFQICNPHISNMHSILVNIIYEDCTPRNRRVLTRSICLDSGTYYPHEHCE